MREHLLDRYDIDYAILLGEEAIEVSTLANPHYASALARAYNDWMIETWLPLDRERLMRGDMNKKPKALWHVAGK